MLIFKKNLIMLCSLMAISLGSISIDSKQKSVCNTEESCLNNDNCLCYCSFKCGYREKTEKDNPIWKDGRCWCQQRDIDYYEKNGCNIADNQ